MFKLIPKILPIKFKLLLAKLISNNLSGWIISKVFRNSIPHHGVKIHTDFKRIRSKTVADIYFGIYERAEIDQVIAYINPDVDVIELGGSIGVNSLHIRRCLHKDKKLLVIEADPELVEILHYNIEENGMKDDVQVLNCAIDYSGREIVSFCVGESNLSGQVFDESNRSSVEKVNVKAVTLGDLVTGYNFVDYTLVSDIEGMEIPIFIEDEKALENCKQIFLEIDGVSYKNIDYSVDDVVGLIGKCGFTIVERYYNCVVFSKQVI